MRVSTGARGTVNARDKGALAVYAQVKRELAEGRSLASASLPDVPRVSADERKDALRVRRELDRAATRELEATGMTCPECESRVIVASGRVVCTNYGGCELSVG